MATSRTVTVWEGQFDKDTLSKNGYKFQIAKSVLTGTGEVTYNTVWQSKAIAPSTRIRWDVVYGLNWTAELPESGITVVVGGQWQAVNKGQSVKLKDNGFFDTPVSGGSAGFLSVSLIDYKYPDTTGIHLVVGVKNSTGDFDPIFVDERPSFKGGSAKYSPIEKVQCWYEAGGRDATIISENRTGVMELDCTNPTAARNAFEWWVNFVTSGEQQGTWNISESKPMQSLMAPPRSVEIDGTLSKPPGKGTQFAIIQTIVPWPITAKIALAAVLLAPQSTNVINSITTYMASIKLKADVKITADNLAITIQYQPKDDAPSGGGAGRSGQGAIGIPLTSDSDPLDPVKQALERCRGLFPSGEKLQPVQVQ